MGNNTVWSVDYHSGIDVLAVDESPSLRPSASATQSSWLRVPLVDPVSEALRRLCRAGASAPPADHARAHALLG